MELQPLIKKIIIDNEDFYEEALPLEHSVPCIGFSCIEQDRRRIDTRKAKKLKIPQARAPTRLFLTRSEAGTGAPFY